MARIEPIPIRQWPPEMRDALAAMVPPAPRYAQPAREDRPKARNFLSTMAHHPSLAQAYFTFSGHTIRATTLTERQRELLVLRVASRRGCRYEWAQHLAMARDAGLDNDEIARVESDPASSQWSDLDAALLRAVDELLGGGAISDGTWAVLAGELDIKQLLDVIFTVGAYDTLAWMMRSVDVELDDELLAILTSHARDR